MIFHTAADTVYYNYFYNFYKTSIKYFYPFSDLSLHYIGKEEIVDPEIKYLSKENINTDKIKEKFNVTDKDAAGYFCLSRWLFLPNVTDNVIVSDVDIIAIKPIDQKNLDILFKTYQIINITRLKKGGSEGGMAMIAIRSDVISPIKEFSNKLLNDKKLHWALDVDVRTFLYENFKTIEIPEMHVLGKRSNFTNYDNTNRSFAIRKGSIEEKIKTLEKAMENLV